MMNILKLGWNFVKGLWKSKSYGKLGLLLFGTASLGAGVKQYLKALFGG